MGNENQTMEFIDFTKMYSIETLGLNKDHGFEKQSKRMRAVYFVCWAPKGELKYDYKLFKSKFLAQLMKCVKSLRNYAYVREAEAYGGMDCPITPSLLESTPSRIAYVVPHEKWHCSVIDYSCSENLMMEESTGNAIANNEAVNMVENFYGKDSEEYKEAVDDREYYRKRAKLSKMLVEELNKLYETMDFDEKDVKGILSKYNKLSEETLDREGWDSVVDVLDDYSYDALYPLAEDVYLRHGYEKSREIFILALGLAQKNGFEHGVKELLKHSELDEKEYMRVINIF